MRIISGTHKGRRLTAPKNLPVRPTTDNAKEGLFNILNNRFYFDDIKVLDVFAGTGNISFEFASRGVTDITSVDAHFGCVKYIRQIADQFSFPIATVKSDVFAYLEKCNVDFDLIFADPPYDYTLDRFKELVDSVFKNSVLSLEGLLIIEHPKQTDLSEIDGFQESRRYGGSVFSFFEV